MTTETKHTPGNWKLSRNENITFTFVHEIIADGKVIAFVNPQNQTDEEYMANARLLVAAKDLLAALTEARYAMFNAKADFGTNYMDDAIEQSDAAIERATKG